MACWAVAWRDVYILAPSNRMWLNEDWGAPLPRLCHSNILVAAFRLQKQQSGQWEQGGGSGVGGYVRLGWPARLESRDAMEQRPTRCPDITSHMSSSARFHSSALSTALGLKCTVSIVYILDFPWITVHQCQHVCVGRRANHRAWTYWLSPRSP